MADAWMRQVGRGKSRPMPAGEGRDWFRASSSRPGWIDRPRLEAVLRGATSAPVVLLEADAGYGKTTTADFLTQRTRRMWYSLTAEDRDPRVFLTKLLDGIDRSDGLGVPAILRSGHADSGDSARTGLSWPTVLDQFLAAIASESGGPVHLVLDDYHNVSHSLVDELVVRLVDRRPANLRLVFASREHLDLPGWVRLRAQGAISSVGSETLAFNADETGRFLRDGFGIDVTNTEAQLLSEETEGWPIGLALIAQRLRDRDQTPEALLAAMPEGRVAIFDFLGEQVFLNQPPDVRQFLLAISCVDELDQRICAAVSAQPERNVAEMLKALATTGAFCVRERAGHYRLHHLFREFLRSQLAPDHYVAIHRRAAEHFRQRGAFEMAARHSIQAGAKGDAAAATAACADRLLNSGRHLTLLDITAPLADVLDSHPRLLIARSWALRLSGRYSEAIADAARAAAAVRDTNLEFDAGEAEVLVHLDTVNPSKAEPILDRLGAGDLDAERRLRWMTLLAENQVNAGHLSVATETLDRLRDLGGVNLATIQMRLLVRRGELQRARSLVEGQSPTVAERIPHAHREESALRSWIHGLLGRGEAALRAAEEGIARGAELHAPIVECVCWGRLGLATASGENVDLDRAQRAFAHALDIASAIDVPRFRAEPLIGLAVISHRLSRPDDTLRYGLDAVETLERAGDRYMVAMARLGTGAALADQSHPDAFDWLNRARRDAAECGDAYIPLICDQWLALLALSRGAHDQFKVHATRALDSTSSLALDEVWISPAWLAIYDRSDRLRWLNAASDLESVGAYASYLTRRLAAPTATNRQRPDETASVKLRIHTLGAFEVIRDGQPIDASAWKRRKALEVIWLLCARDRHSANREQAIDTIWPGESGEAVNLRFRVALHALQLALEPDRRRGEPTRFVMTTPDRVWLNPDSVVVDTDRFRALADAAMAGAGVTTEQQLRAALDALDLYQGTFLADEPYLDWIEPTRTALTGQFRDLAISTAAQLTLRGDYAHASALGRRVLAVDPYHDEAYRVIVTAYLAAGDARSAARVYEDLRRMMRSDLGLEPSWTLSSIGEPRGEIGKPSGPLRAGGANVRTK